MRVRFPRVLFTAAACACFANASRAEVDLRIDARPLGDPIEIHVLAQNAGAPMAGLSADDFAVTLDGEPVTEFAMTRPRSLGADVKASVAIVTGFMFVQDVGSGSYAELVRRLKPEDHVSIVKFRFRPSGEFTHLFMSTFPFTQIDPASTIEAVGFLGTDPEFYDSWSWGHAGPSPAIHALEEFEAAEAWLPPGPRALVGAIAPGENQFTERAIADDIAVFNVGYSGENLANFLAKRGAARETGGALVVIEDESQDDLAVRRIGDWLNDAYRLSIPAARVEDCDLHVLGIVVRGETMLQPFARCDSAPDPFVLEMADGVEPGVVLVSPAVTITGIESPVPVEVFGGEYSVGCTSAFTSEPGYLQPLDTVCVRHTTSTLPNDLVQTVLSVGSRWSTFESLTRYFQPPPNPPPSANGGGGPAGAIEILLLLGGLLLRQRLRT